MTNGNLSSDPAANPDLLEARNEVNNLLHELETMVDPVQHQNLTNFLVEWSVLSAMRTTLALQDKATNTGGSPATATENSDDSGTGKGA